jgi:hypothetical protein
MFNHLKLKHKNNTRPFTFKYFKSDGEFPVINIASTNASLNKKAFKFYFDNQENLEKIKAGDEKAVLDYTINMLSEVGIQSWQGIKDDKAEDVACTPENIKKFLTAIYDLLGVNPLNDMFDFSARQENYVEEAIEVTYAKAKKLGK